MLRGLAVAVALALFLAAAPAAPVPTGPRLSLAPPPFFPTSVGTKWVYQDGDYEWTEIITAVETQKDGAFNISISRVGSDGKTTLWDQVLVSDRSLTRLAVKGVPFKKPVCLLKLPHKSEQTWENDFNGRALTFEAFEPERIKVPAGEYEALPVEVQRPGWGNETYWYARGVGLVKMEISSGDTVLKSFTPVKK